MQQAQIYGLEAHPVKSVIVELGTPKPPVNFTNLEGVAISVEATAATLGQTFGNQHTASTEIARRGGMFFPSYESVQSSVALFH